MKKSLDKHIRMGYGSDPENPRPRKACAGFAFMAGAPSQANGVPSANEGQSAGRPFPENRMSELIESLERRIRALEHEVAELRARPVHVPYPVITPVPSYPQPIPWWQYPTVTCSTTEAHIGGNA